MLKLKEKEKKNPINPKKAKEKIIIEQLREKLLNLRILREDHLNRILEIQHEMNKIKQALNNYT